MNGAKSGAKAANTAEAVAGPTPLSTVSSETALEISGSDLNAFSDADFTTASSKDETKSNKRGLEIHTLYSSVNNTHVRTHTYIY